MSDVISRASIEITADTRELRGQVEEAKKSIASLGAAQADATKSSQASVARYITSLGQQTQTMGMTTDQAKLMQLGFKGASDVQLQVAESAQKMIEKHKQWVELGDQMHEAFLAIGAAAIAGLGAAAVAFDELIKSAGEYHDIGIKIGDDASAVASLAIAAAAGGVSIDQIAASSLKLTRALAGTGTGAKAAEIAVKALGLNLAEFKSLTPVEQLQLVATAMAGFADDQGKSAIAMALFGKAGAEQLTFLKALGGEYAAHKVLTDEQIKAAEDYAEKQRALKAEFVQAAEVLAVALLPQLLELGKSLISMVTEGDKASTAVDLLKGAFKAAIIVFQTIAVVGSNVGFVFQTVGREIGGMIGALNALAHFDLKGFDAISREVQADVAKSRLALDKFNVDVMNLGKEPAPAPGAGAGRGTTVPSSGLPSLKGVVLGTPRVDRSGAAAAAALDKADLALQLEQIKKASEATLEVYSNEAKMLAAYHAAGLIDDTAYYKATIALTQASTKEKVDAIDLEIAAMEKKKFTGKNAAAEQVKNTREIEIAEAARAKVLTDSTTAETVAAIAYKAAQDKKVAAIRDLIVAEQDYLDLQTRAQQRELAGMGTGDAARAAASARLAVGDRYDAEALALTNARTAKENVGPLSDSDKTYYTTALADIDRFKTKALASYDDYYKQRLKQEGNWATGAKDAMNNYIADAANVAKQTDTLFSNAFKGMEDALVTFVTTGKLNFKDLANSILAELARMEIKAAMSSILKGVSGASGDSGIWGSILGAVTGGGSASGGLDASAAGNIATGYGTYAQGTNYVPTTGLALVHQGEAVIPASMNNLNSPSGASGSPPVTVNVVNNGAPVSATASTPKFDGKKYVIDVVLNTLRTDQNFRNSLNTGLRAPT